VRRIALVAFEKGFPQRASTHWVGSFLFRPLMSSIRFAGREEERVAIDQKKKCGGKGRVGRLGLGVIKPHALHISPGGSCWSNRADSGETELVVRAQQRDFSAIAAPVLFPGGAHFHGTSTE